MFTKENTYITMISDALVRIADNPTYTINNIINDLSLNDEEMLNCLTSNLKIDRKEFYQVDKSLLDLPIPQVKHILSFNNFSLNDLIQKREEQLQKWEEEARIEEEEDAKEEKRRSEHRFWTDDELEIAEDEIDGLAPYYDALVIYMNPYNFLKECVQSLRNELYNEDPNMAKLRSLADQINEFFNE